MLATVVGSVGYWGLSVKNFRFTYNKGVVDEVSGIIRHFHLPRDVDAMMDEIDGVGMPLSLIHI